MSYGKFGRGYLTNYSGSFTNSSLLRYVGATISENVHSKGEPACRTAVDVLTEMDLAVFSNLFQSIFNLKF